MIADDTIPPEDRSPTIPCPPPEEDEAPPSTQRTFAGLPRDVDGGDVTPQEVASLLDGRASV